MHARIDDISTSRAPKLAVDRHAVGMAGEVLTMALRLEQKLKSVAERRSASVQTPIFLASGHLFNVKRSSINQSRNEEL